MQLHIKKVLLAVLTIPVSLFVIEAGHVAAASPVNTPLHMDTGSSTSYVDKSGTKWVPDQYYTGGSVVKTTAGIRSTSNTVVFQTERSGMSKYHIPVNNGTYQLKLDMVETHWSAPRMRLFSIAVEGKTVANNLDLYSKVGKNQLYVLTTPSIKVSDGYLDVTYTATRSTATVSGLEIAKVVTPIPVPTPVPIPTPAPSPTPSPSAPVTYSDTAQQNADFLDSIGVNVHTGYTDTPYGNSTNVAAQLSQLGIHAIRDNHTAGDATDITALQTLQSNGITFDFVHLPKTATKDTATGLLNDIKTYFLGSTDSVEGLNEPDNKLGSTWASQTCKDQIDLYTKFKQDSLTTDIPIVAPSLLSRSEAQTAPVLANACTIGNYIDAGNVHSYPGGNMPEAVLPTAIGIEQQNISTTKPLIVSETGYTNGLTSTSGQAPISKTAAGIYAPRLYLESFSLGAQRTYAYELYDEVQAPLTNTEDNFGLINNDLSLKPAATALQNMTTILSDQTTAATAPQTLTYSIDDGSNSDLQHMLLQKSDGTFYLALWRKQSVWDSTARKDLTFSDTNLTLGFNQPMNTSIYKPNTSSSSLDDQLAQTSLQVPVGPDVTFVKIAPTIPLVMAQY